MRHCILGPDTDSTQDWRLERLVYMFVYIRVRIGLVEKHTLCVMPPS